MLRAVFLFLQERTIFLFHLFKNHRFALLLHKVLIFRPINSAHFLRKLSNPPDSLALLSSGKIIAVRTSDR